MHTHATGLLGKLLLTLYMHFGDIGVYIKVIIKIYYNGFSCFIQNSALAKYIGFNIRSV